MVANRRHRFYLRNARSVNTVKEFWRDVVDYEDRYEVSSAGQVRTKERQGFHPKNKHGGTHFFKVYSRLKKTTPDKYGYLQVALANDEGNKTVTVHRLVARAFVPGQTAKLQVNHKNGNRKDNRAHNLEWVTASENVRHTFAVLGRVGLKGESNGSSKLTETKVRVIRKLLSTGLRQKDIAARFGVKQTVISSIKLRKTWRHI